MLGIGTSAVQYYGPDESCCLQHEVGIHETAFEQQTRDQKRLYIKVFDQWKKEQKLPYTWDTIMNALKEVGENETVHDIRKWLRGETTSSDPSHSTASAAGENTLRNTILALPQLLVRIRYVILYSV